MSEKNNHVSRLTLELSLLAALVICSVGITSADANDRDGRLLTAGPPIYPAYCLKKRLQGYVDLVFIVDANGLVQDPSVVNVVVYRKSEDSLVEDERASQAFIWAATNAISNYRYEPPIKNGVVLVMEGVKTRITFEIER